MLRITEDFKQLVLKYAQPISNISAFVLVRFKVGEDIEDWKIREEMKHNFKCLAQEKSAQVGALLPFQAGSFLWIGNRGSGSR